MRTIDADHVTSMLHEYLKREQAYIDIGNNKAIAISHSNGLWEAIAQIDEEPTIEPPRMRGRWIGCGNSDHWKCSVCGTRAAFWFSEETSSEWEWDMSEWLSDFCPNCGSYNGGEQDVNH